MLNFIVTENAIRPSNSHIHSDGYLVQASTDMTILPHDKITLNTGLILKFQSHEFVYFIIDDLYSNILRIEDKIYQDTNGHIFSITIENITNNTINISKDNNLYHFYTMDNCALRQTLLNILSEKNNKNINITNSVINSENNIITIDNTEADKQANLEADKQAKLQAKLETEKHAIEQAKENSRLQAKKQAKLQAKLEAENKARLKAKLQADEQAKLESEKQAKLEADEQAKLESEKQAKLETDEQAKLEAEDYDIKECINIEECNIECDKIQEAFSAQLLAEKKLEMEIKNLSVNDEIKDTGASVQTAQDAISEEKPAIRRKYVRKKKLISVEHLINP